MNFVTFRSLRIKVNRFFQSYLKNTLKEEKQIVFAIWFANFENKFLLKGNAYVVFLLKAFHLHANTFLKSSASKPVLAQNQQWKH